MSFEYQLMDRIGRIKTRVLEVRTRAKLPLSTPVLDRLEGVLRARQAGQPILPILGRAAMAPPAAPPAPASAPPATQTQVIRPEELGIEAR
ncbi:MAG: hypothetical protein QW304_07885 [Thermoproteota archaeon]